MTDEELYDVLTNDSTAEKYLSNNDYKSLFKYIFSQYRDVKPNELTALLLNAGIDIFEDGEIPYTMYMGDKTLKSFDFSRVTKVGRFAFKDTGITTANLRSVTEIGDGAFFDSDLTEVYLKNGVEIGTAAFGRCEFTELYIPENTKMHSSAFAGCDKLETVVIDGINIESDMSAFQNCRHIDNIFIYSNRMGWIKTLLEDSIAKEVTINVIPTEGAPYDEDSVRDYVNTFTKFNPEQVTVKEVN